MVQSGMRKAEAIELLGGSVAAVADAIGISYQAVDKWPDDLPPRIADRVHAALWRKANGIALPSKDEPAAKSSKLPKKTAHAVASESVVWPLSQQEADRIVYGATQPPRPPGSERPSKPRSERR